MKFDVIVEKDESGVYIAYVPALPGCYSQGDSIEEAIKNIKEAIELHLSTLPKEKKKELESISRNIVGITKVEVHA